jgi:regulatory protein
MEAAFRAMTLLCARREYCTHDIREKLRTKELSPDETSAILERLQQEGYINDARYARAYAHDKLLYDGWGRIKIAQSLRMKRIADNLVQEALDELSEEQYLETLRRVVRSKQRSVKGKTPYETRQKLARSVINRGFEPSLVFKEIGSSDEDAADDWMD